LFQSKLRVQNTCAEAAHHRWTC